MAAGQIGQLAGWLARGRDKRGPLVWVLVSRDIASGGRSGATMRCGERRGLETRRCQKKKMKKKNWKSIHELFAFFFFFVLSDF